MHRILGFEFKKSTKFVGSPNNYFGGHSRDFFFFLQNTSSVSYLKLLLKVTSVSTGFVLWFDVLCALLVCRTSHAVL